MDAKRLYSLAYTRAQAALKRAHEEEFTRLLDAHKANIIAEQVLTGDVERLGFNSVKHHAGEDGRCVECGAQAPCEMEKRRLRRARQLAREV